MSVDTLRSLKLKTDFRSIVYAKLYLFESLIYYGLLQAYQYHLSTYL